MKTYLPKLLIVGGFGQLGLALAQHPLDKSFTLLLPSRIEFDITDASMMLAYINQFKPDIIINSAAYTAVDKAENEQEAAFAVNHVGAKNLASICGQLHIPLIHISTDYVFDGHKTSPYLETDKANALNIYGVSKYLGEEAVRIHCEQHIILRVSGIFSEFRHNFLKTILRLAQEKKEIAVVADQMTCPTYAGDIASAIYQLAQNPTCFGTYHYCSESPTSWHGFASFIIEEAKKYQSSPLAIINATTAQAFGAPAKRPKNSVLDCQKIAKAFGIIQPDWKVGVEKALANCIS